jgi:superfamily II DNA or RNA helicase
MSGSQSAKEKRRVAAYLDELKRSGRAALILSTGKYIGEGFDFPALDTLILATPIAWKGSITQYVGRVSRQYEGKSEILVLDYVDFRVPVLTRMFAKRVKAFKKEGFAITQHGQKPEDELVYTRETYWTLLERDLREVSGPILFSTPYVSPPRVQRLLPLLKELSESKPVVVRVPMGTSSTLLGSHGITLQHTAEDLVNCILIGERILWYGSINIFGAVEESDSLLRIEDPTYAAQVMRWLEGSEEKEVKLPLI